MRLVFALVNDKGEAIGHPTAEVHLTASEGIALQNHVGKNLTEWVKDAVNISIEANGALDGIEVTAPPADLPPVEVVPIDRIAEMARDLKECYDEEVVAYQHGDEILALIGRND
jgi:hypothetical protein